MQCCSTGNKQVNDLGAQQAVSLREPVKLTFVEVFMGQSCRCLIGIDAVGAENVSVGSLQGMRWPMT